MMNISNDSGVDTSNDSNDNNNFLTFPAEFIPSTLVHPNNEFMLREPIIYNTKSPRSSHPHASSSTTHGRSLKVYLSKSWNIFNRVGSMPYDRSHANETKLRLAASLSNVELLIRLLESGVNPNGSDNYQRSALHLAASRGYADVVTQLLKHGAKPNLKDSLGNTPLHLAVCSASSLNFNMVVRTLIKHGASVHAVDRMGKTALDLAKGKLSLMRMRNQNVQNGPESTKILLDMSILTTFLVYTYTKENESFADMDSLEMRLSNLSTKEVEDEADNLLAKMETLTLKN